MRDALLRIQGAWGAPASSLTAGAEWLVGRSIDLRLRRARHLVAVGRMDAALRLYGAVTDDVAASHALVRWWGGRPVTRAASPARPSSVTALAALRQRLLALALPAP